MNGQTFFAILFFRDTMSRVNYEISKQLTRILKRTILNNSIDPLLDESNEYDGLERFLIDRTPIPYPKN